MVTLSSKIDSFMELGNELPPVPHHITDNLAPAVELRPYQNEAFSRLIYYLNNPKLKKNPAQLLFHMATGSGKTLIMAGSILHLYTLGYRDFLFFVNNKNIINKTRDNFLNPLSIKYLFSRILSINNTLINIHEVDNFQTDTGKNSINILFSTIQGLHSNLNTPKENIVTYDDFSSKKIVLISDEAHHINVDTKNGKLTLEEEETKQSWETTVNRIFNANSENILLEFTATIDMTNTLIAEKYNDKLLFDYPLKKYRLEKYSKEVQVLQSDTSPFQRALQAVLLSQYRRKVFEANKKIIKPVLLFKSKTIIESKAFYTEFIERMNNLTKKDFDAIYKTKETVLKNCIKYFSDNKISVDNLISELKSDFSEEKCLEVNGKEESEEKQVIVNTLEDNDNEYRAIFAVDKLNEGWDVLNLFDIVRLYDTRDADTKTGRPGTTTVAEAQLIGRGARYCPFQTDETQTKYQRKYDDDLDNLLRICEELYYHAAYNPRYISELHNALNDIGIKDKNSKELQLSLKMDFKETDFYKDAIIYTNKQNKYDRSDINSLPPEIIGKLYRHELKTGLANTTAAFDVTSQKSLVKKARDYKLQDFGFPVIWKAISKTGFFWYENILSFLPNIGSLYNFITSPDYLGRIKIEVSGNQDDIDNLSYPQKMRITLDVLNNIAVMLQSDQIEFKGSEEFEPYNFKDVFKDKKLNVVVNDSGDKEYGVPQTTTTNADLRIDLSQKNWYVFNDNYGTSEEKYLVKYIDRTYETLKSRYKDIYLVRNEGHFKIYSFEGGQPFEPDFVLFLTEKKSDVSVYYQVFIEPKGEHLFEHDAWKEKFLLSLRSRHKIKQLWKTKNYIVWGMPFFNSNTNDPDKYPRFDNAFQEIVD